MLKADLTRVVKLDGYLTNGLRAVDADDDHMAADAVLLFVVVVVVVFSLVLAVDSELVVAVVGCLLSAVVNAVVGRFMNDLLLVLSSQLF